jgi:DNA replication protein DnaC
MLDAGLNQTAVMMGLAARLESHLDLATAGDALNLIMKNLEAGLPAIRRPEAKMKKEEGIPPKFRRDKVPSQAAQAFAQLKGRGEAWLSGENSDWAGATFFGGLGVCKTSVAVQFAWLFFDAGRHVRFEMAAEMLDNWKSFWKSGAESELTEKTLLESYIRPDLLILDDVGIQFKTEAERNLLYKVLVKRHNLMKPSILTTNLNLDAEEDEKIFYDCVGKQVADRLSRDLVNASKWGGNVR